MTVVFVAMAVRGTVTVMVMGTAFLVWMAPDAAVDPSLLELKMVFVMEQGTAWDPEVVVAMDSWSGLTD